MKWVAFRNLVSNALLTVRPYARRRFERIIADLDPSGVAFFASYITDREVMAWTPEWMARCVYRACIASNVRSGASKLEARWPNIKGAATR